jgi:hypothetical protein
MKTSHKSDELKKKGKKRGGGPHIYCTGKLFTPNLVSSPIKGILEILNLTLSPVHSDGYFGMDGLCRSDFIYRYIF